MSTPLVTDPFPLKKSPENDSQKSKSSRAKFPAASQHFTLQNVLEMISIGLKQFRDSATSISKLPNVVILQKPSLADVTRTTEIDIQAGPTLVIADQSNLSQSDLDEIKSSGVHLVDGDSENALLGLVDETVQHQQTTVVLISEQLPISEIPEQPQDPQHKSVPSNRVENRPVDISAAAEIQKIVPEEVARLDRRSIWAKTFSKDARKWIARYNTVGHRDLYLWQWCLHGIELTRLPCVESEWSKFVDDTKLLSVILCVLFDDVADRDIGDSQKSSRWLESLISVARGKSNGNTPTDWLKGSQKSANSSKKNSPTGCVDQKNSTRKESLDEDSQIELHVNVTGELWEEYVLRLSQTPMFDEFESLWKFDIDQFLSAMEYSQLVNLHPGLANPTEHDVYTPHNMLMVSFGTIDLMCSPQIRIEEYGTIREMLWHAQAMGRIGNILATWQRELRERDNSNGFVSRAIADGVLSLEEANRLTPRELEKRIQETHYEQELLDRWKKHRIKCQSLASKVQTMELAEVLAAHDRFLQMHISSHGLI